MRASSSPHHQDVAGSAADDLRADRPEHEALDAALVAPSDDEQVGVELARGLDQLFGRVSHRCQIAGAYVPAEEALSKLEPFLLDIANLPDKPSENELRGIRERLQKKEMIASLQISSSPHATAAFQNP